MPNKVAKNTFIKGMNKDVSPLFINKASYMDATNFRLSVNEDSSLGTLENVKGNELLLSAAANLASSGDLIVGHVVLEDKLVLFTHRINNPIDNNISKIQVVTFNGNNLNNVILLWSDNGKSDDDKLNISTSSIIKAVARKEAIDIEKIYWVDNDNYLRFANIYTYLTTDGLVKSGSNDYISAKAFGTVASVIFDEPLLVASGGGGLNVGMVQYSYQLYNKNGSETSFSPATGLFHLTSSSDSGADSSGYSGNPVEDESGKSFTLRIDLTDYEYDSIRIVSIHYEHYQQLPTINIITEKAIPSNGTVSFTDRGTGYIGSYTIEQFTAIAGLYKSKDIASSKNYLFLANVAENYFNIGDYDARAYRFKENTNVDTDILTGKIVADTVSPNNCVMTYLSDISLTITIPNFSIVFDIPSNREVTDVISVTKDGTTTIRGHYERASDSATIDFGSPTTNVLIGSIPTYTVNTDTLSFTVTSIASLFNGDGVDDILDGILAYLNFTYEYLAPVEARVYEGDGYYYRIQADGSWVYKNSSDVTVTSGSDWSLPETSNLLNYFNDTTNDASASHNYIYKKDSSILGGDGLNIEYAIIYDLQTVDDNAYPYTLKTSKTAVTYDSVPTIGWEGYRSPFFSAYGKSYQRGETYRFGIIFFDKFGRQSVVKWIADIRMPDNKWRVLADKSGNNNRVYSIYPRFKISNYPDEAVGFKIVRVERGAEDKSIVMTGLVRPTGVYGDSGHRQPFFGIGQTGEIDLQEFISPEISFYKDFTPINNDYIVIDEFAQKIQYNLRDRVEIPEEAATEDGVLKCRKISPYYIYATTDEIKGKVVGPGESGETTIIEGITYRPYYNQQDGDREAYKGTSLIFSGNNHWSYTGGALTGKSPAQACMWGSYRRHIYEAQYGGPYYASRTANEYIGASPVYKIPANKSIKSAYAVQGDTFIGYMDHTALYWGPNIGSDGNFYNFLFPVESSINVDLRHDDSFTRVYNNSTYSYRDISEEGNIDADLSELYLYNTVYSQENNNKLYFPQPADEEPVEEKTFNTRIIVSEKKFNGEESDSWLSFLTNNFIDVDANQGELNNIKDYNNNLLFWQPRGIGMVDVDPRSLITDNNPGALVLGTGAVLSRFDYLSTLTGNTNDYGLVTTPRGIYWHDSINNTLVRYDGKAIERLSKTKGIQSYMNENKFDNGLLAYHAKYDEVLFTLTDGSGSDVTLIFNEFANVFTGFYSFIPLLYANVADRFISTDNRSELWIHDTIDSNYGEWYAGTVADSTLKIAINEAMDTIKVFDNINYSLYAYDSNDILQYNTNFESIRCYNSYQNTDTITLTNTNVNRKKGLWSLQIPRNAVNASPDTEPDIFNAGNLDATRTFRERMRDAYIVTDLILNNDSDDRVQIPFINTKYRINYR